MSTIPFLSSQPPSSAAVPAVTGIIGWQYESGKRLPPWNFLLTLDLIPPDIPSIALPRPPQPDLRAGSRDQQVTQGVKWLSALCKGKNPSWSSSKLGGSSSDPSGGGSGVRGLGWMGMEQEGKGVGRLFYPALLAVPVLSHFPTRHGAGPVLPACHTFPGMLLAHLGCCCGDVQPLLGMGPAPPLDSILCDSSATDQHIRGLGMFQGAARRGFGSQRFLWKALGGRRAPGAPQSLLMLLFWHVGISSNIPSWCWDLLLQWVPGSLLPSHGRVISASEGSH